MSSRLFRSVAPTYRDLDSARAVEASGEIDRLHLHNFVRHFMKNDLSQREEAITMPIDQFHERFPKHEFLV
jgi:hypothetical protein